MNDRSFDDLARLAARQSRRRLLQGCALALVGVRSRLTVAQARGQGAVALGGICATSEECRQEVMQGDAVCNDNGFGPAGSTHCCAESGCCGGDADCCGARRCAPTGDVCSVCSLPPFPTRYPGEICVEDDDCVQSVIGRIVCIEDRCAFLDGRVVSPRPDRLDPEAALAAAAHLSLLEAAGEFDALYDRMHPDAQAIVARQVVVGWYREAFAPLGPEPAEAVKVRFVPWTWPVTGKRYPDTAEVAFRQAFADRPLVRDEVRLVRTEAGAWAWFFGRDRAFVDEQVARYGT